MLLKAFVGAEVVLAGAMGAVFLATVADNWVPVLAVLGAVATSAVSPVVMSNLNNRAAERRAAQAADIAQAAQKRDWARQDEVAAHVLEASKATAATAKTLVASNAEVAVEVSEVKTAAAAAQETTEAKLDVIHALVNSNLTASMKSQLAALRASAVALTTLANYQESSGKSVFSETRQQAEDIDKTANLLEDEIQDRLAAEASTVKNA